MAAPKNNQFWKARSKHGAKPKFSSPDVLWTACEEYFEWVEANPLKEAKLFAFQGTVTIAKVDKMRPMTVSGLCLFLGISLPTWVNYRANDDLTEIVTRVDEIIYTQKFEGAAADLLNANIIARDLGLANKSDNTTTLETGDSLKALLDAIDGKTRSIPEKLDHPST